jgi:hypothetical protein
MKKAKLLVVTFAIVLTSYAAVTKPIDLKNDFVNQSAELHDAKGTVTLNLYTPKDPKKSNLEALYRVRITCSRNKDQRIFPTDTDGWFVKSTVLRTHTISIINGDLTSPAIPAADKTMLLMPVFSVTGDNTNKTFFNNIGKGCSRPILLSGRDRPTIVANLYVAEINKPSEFASLLYGIVSFITPTAPLFGGHLGKEFTTNINAINNTQSPLQNFISQLDNAKSVFVHAQLPVGTTVIKSSYSYIVIEVEQIETLTGKNKNAEDDVFLSDFERTFDTYGQKLATTSDAGLRQACASLGHSLQFNRNLGIEDVAYALAHAAYLGGMSKQQIIQCFGSEYGTAVIDSNWWITHRDNRKDVPKIHSWEFPPSIDNSLSQPAFAGRFPFFQLLAHVLTESASGRMATPSLDRFFNKQKASEIKEDKVDCAEKEKVVIFDSTATINMTFTEVPTNGKTICVAQLLKELADNGKGYTTFGCPVSDNISDKGQGAAAAMLALKPTAKTKDGQYGPSDALAIRFWFDSEDRIGIMRISADGPTIDNIFSSFKSFCSKDIKLVLPPK